MDLSEESASRRPTSRRWRQALRRLPGVALLVCGAVAGITALSDSTTSAQGRLAALPLEDLARSRDATTSARVALGRLLFWDPILSGPKDVACATCHHPAFGYADGRDLSIGVNGVGLGAARTFAPGHLPQTAKRNSQSILNVAFNGLIAGARFDPAAAPMFWDLRVRGLETQALEPIRALDEMRGGALSEARAVATVVARLDGISEYRRLFARAFSDERPVNAQNLGRALAAFQRTLVAVNTPFDRYMRGDATAMTPEQVRGMERFQAIGCANCHKPPMFSDFSAHVLGVPDNARLPTPDTGVNGTYGFRTPSLRNLSATGPYMHNGVFTTLPQVLNFYRRISRGGGGRAGRGGRRAGNLNAPVPRAQVDVLAQQLRMRRGGRQDLLTFLQALDDPDFDRTIPERVPSGLAVGGRVAP